MTITRFAPSPTGYLHIGNLRAALMNYIISRQVGGSFILRVDDTDHERCREEYVEAVKEDLTWLGLCWDRIERQSARLDRYDFFASKLREMGLLYECFETPIELDLKRKKQLNMGKPPVYDRAALALSEGEKANLRDERGPGHWRFKLCRERVQWTDGILGEVSIDASSVSDPVLLRGDGQYLYTLASVVDDVEMGITNVVRGSDHVTNTATQIQIIKALGGNVPQFAHHSLLVGLQGEGLSKRLGTLSLRDMRREGIMPQALISLMSRIGSSQPVELQIDIKNVLETFELSNFNSAPTKFNKDDLFPLTARYLQTLSFNAVSTSIADLGIPDRIAEDFWKVVRENIATLNDLAGWWKICSQGAEPVISKKDASFVKTAVAMMPIEPYNNDTWEAWTTEVKKVTGRKGKGLFMPLRLALTGQEYGPDMKKLLPLLQNIKVKSG